MDIQWLSFSILFFMFSYILQFFTNSKYINYKFETSNYSFATLFSGIYKFVFLDEKNKIKVSRVLASQ